ncbi:MAG: hypothetical protein K8T89_10000 [Planctomycetes bacterium]|nr:hypothetical protein [Planctomycetota bacterium]
MPLLPNEMCAMQDVKRSGWIILSPFLAFFTFAAFARLAAQDKGPPSPEPKVYHFECIPLLVKNKTPEKLTITSNALNDLTAIRNPYHQRRAWRLWFQDSSPI